MSNSPIGRVFGHVLAAVRVSDEEHQHRGDGRGCGANVVARFAVVQRGVVQEARQRDAQQHWNRLGALNEACEETFRNSALNRAPL